MVLALAGGKPKLKKKIIGQFENLRATSGDTAVQGDVDGATVTAGAGLEVTGNVRGNIEVAEDGVLAVQGLFSPGTVTNDGMIMASGMVQADLDDLGNFAAAVGSMIGRQVIGPDGALRDLADVDDLEPTIDVGSVSGWCAWLVDEQRFIPMPELKARTAAATGTDEG